MIAALVAFLRARLDEDERAARAAEGHWIDAFVSDEGAAHLQRWGAARVLREVEAKRRIIDEHSPVDPCDAHDAELRSVPCDTLRLLALPYADHEQFREEWRV